MKKTFLFSLLLGLFTLTLGSCQSAADQLEEAVKIADKDCPVVVEQGMVIQSVKYANDDVTFNFEIDENLYGNEFIEMAETVRGDMKKEMKKEILHSGDEDIEALVDLCREAGADIAFKLTGVPSGKSMTITINNDEL